MSVTTTLGFVGTQLELALRKDQGKVHGSSIYPPKPASGVKKSVELEAFLDSCRDDWLREKTNEGFLQLKGDYEIGDKVFKDKWPKHHKQTWGTNNFYKKCARKPLISIEG